MRNEEADSELLFESSRCLEARVSVKFVLFSWDQLQQLMISSNRD